MWLWLKRARDGDRPSGANLERRDVDTFKHSRNPLRYLSRNSLLFSLYIIVVINLIVAPSSAAKSEAASSNATNSTKQEANTFRLDCQPGEQRQFSYESSTRVWGSSQQQVQLRAELRLKCMEAPTNSTLKYLAEIVSIVPIFNSPHVEQQSRNSKLKLPAGSKHNVSQYDELGVPRAEPLLEEVGEVAQRMKRSVSGWFNKTWLNVKDFFVNLFSSSERSSISREQAIKESGLDIGNQCKSKGKNSKTPGGLPMDDSVFDDLQPEYYIGASLDGTSGHGITAYEFSSNTANSADNAQADSEQDESETLSFFDDPKPARTKRAAGNTKPEDFGRQIRMPFVFIQSKSGKISEIRFGSDELDTSVKNFKRHLCDLFATNLDATRQTQNEVSPIGRHQTKYTLDSSANSIDDMKQSLIKTSNKMADEQATKQLVRVLATVGGNGRGGVNDSLDLSVVGEADAEQSRDPIGSQGDQQVAVMRTINTTSSLQLSGGSNPVRMSNTMLAASDIDQLQVHVKQVQQINDGRLTGTAGQLSMSLVKSANPTGDYYDMKLDDDDEGEQSLGELFAARNGRRLKRSDDVSDRLAPSSSSADLHVDNHDQNQIEDIADLLQVSTSFSLRLVPIARRADGSVDPESGAKSAKLQLIKPNRVKRATGTAAAANETTTKAKRKWGGSRLLVERPPSDSQALQRMLQDWRKLEARLQLSSSNLVSESTGPMENQLQRLELMRDQVRLRLNEEYLRNKIRRSFGARQMASLAAPAGSNGDDSGESFGKQRDGASRSPTSSLKDANDLGLGLTQLILGNGITTKQKGSIYQTLEEIIELESGLLSADEFSSSSNNDQSSISRLMRETIRMDKLNGHCRLSIATIDQVGQLATSSKQNGKNVRRRHDTSRASSKLTSNIELKHPFGVEGDEDEAREKLKAADRSAVDLNDNINKWQHKFNQCKQVLQLMLKLSNKQAADLVLEMIDDCNQRLAIVAKNEELGYGPAGKYYRHVRQQLIELLANYNRPSEQLLDKLMSRLYYSRLQSSSETTKPSAISQSPRRSQQEPEFVYVSPTSNQQQSRKFNKSILKEEDDYNNNDAAGLMVATLTQLATKRTIGQAKRVRVVEKLLASLKGTSCSLFDGPDLDILESMSNFQEPLEELVPKVLYLARKCRHSDQYVIACLHALSGQMQSQTVQRYLNEQLKSANVSCSVKSEIVSTLIGVQLTNDLRLITASAARDGSRENQESQSAKTTNSSSLGWPNQGLNQVDMTLLDLAMTSSKSAPVDEQQRRRLLDKRCLKQLVVHYLSRKRNTSFSANRADQQATSSSSSPPSVGGKPNLVMRPLRRNVFKRAVVNENNFWDEAECKRWTIPSNRFDEALFTSANSLNVSSSAYNSTAGDLIDEIDDNSILNAILNHQQEQSNAASSRMGRRRNPKLIERELGESSLNNSSAASAGGGSSTAGASIRKRHKCTASKSFGPRSAQATLKTEIVNDLVGPKDENKFLARFRLSTNFLGQKIDVGRMYLWHQRRTTRAHANILGRSIWDTSHNCHDQAPNRLLYMPLFDFSLWLVKVSVGLRLNAEMGFFSDCKDPSAIEGVAAGEKPSASFQQQQQRSSPTDELELFPRVSLRAAGEASAKFVVARAGMSLASNYAYQGNIRVSKQPESCMSVYSAHQPMNLTFSSWFQLWDNDCHFWGSRNRAEPQATKWRLSGRKPIAWLEDECLLQQQQQQQARPTAATSAEGARDSNANLTGRNGQSKAAQTISP